MPSWCATLLLTGVVIAQYFCGLATVTSASRMAFAFARDGGLPASSWVRWVSPTFRTPPVAIWEVSIAAMLFTVSTPVYSTITVVCVIFLYASYVLPTAIGVLAHGRWWNTFGPWELGVWFRPLGLVSVIGSVGLIVIGIQPPNTRGAYVVAAMAIGLTLLWFLRARHRFPGPPHGVMNLKQKSAIVALEAAVHEPASSDSREPNGQ